MWRKRFIAFILLLAGAGIGFAIYQGEKNPESIFGEKPFKYGLDIQGGSEPVVQTEEANTLSGNPSQRLIVELPGVTDIKQAVELIGQTPLLEFKIERSDGEEKK